MLRFAVSVALLIGCGAGHRPSPKWPDAPVQLRDESDRDAAIDRLWVMPLGPERDRARTQIASALASRIADALDEEQPFVAARLFDQLTWMWQDDPQRIGAGLEPHVELLHQLRGLFAKSGALEPAVQTLVVLAEVEPDQRASHLAELDEILAFADDLAIAENGENAGRAQPIDLLEPTAVALPLPWLVDRYVTLLLERQREVSALIEKEGASLQLVRAHQDILVTARRIAIVLARARRPAEIHGKIGSIKGLGFDRELALRAEMVALAPTPDAYGELALALRTHDTVADPTAALAVAVVGLQKFPDDPTLLASAGEDAKALGRVDQAIAFYERAIRNMRVVDTAGALRLGKLYGERISRFASNGRPNAAKQAWQAALDFTDRAAKARPHMVWQQTAAIAESALGKGLASQGLVRDGRGALEQSLERAPSIDAYETLATLDIQTDHPREAHKWAASGISLLNDATIGDRYRRAKLERLAGDALRRANKPKEAATPYLDALRSWSSLGDDKELPRAIAAERRLEFARVLYWLGDGGKAVDHAMEALELDPESPTIAASTVAFLIEAGRYRDAVDAFHRGLGAQSVGELYKVYMSLWIVAEARRLGEPRDPIATEFLSSRRGDLWYELLAKAATNRLSFDALRAAATTGPRKGELAFYGAVLGLDPEATTAAGKKKLLQQAVDAKVIFDAEYDLARRYLSAP
jgi:tetratricopeptide (TPR) repeat protein